MTKLLEGFDNYINKFQNITDKTGLIKKEILISYLVFRYYGKEVESEMLYKIQSDLKNTGIKNKIFEKYIIESLIAVLDGSYNDIIEGFKLNLVELKKKNIKINFISKIFLLICPEALKNKEINEKYNVLIKSNHFIKKSKLLPIVYFMDELDIDIEDFKKRYKEYIEKGFVKSSELMYLTILSLKYDIFPNLDNVMIDKRVFYPLLAVIETLKLKVDDDMLLNYVNDLKENSKIHFYDDNYYLIALIDYILLESSIKSEENKILFDITLLHLLITLIKEISYLD